jgi:outer membrane protein assembly factor BamB
MRIIILFSLLIVFTSCSYLETLPFSAPERGLKHFHVIWSKANDPDYDTGNLPIAMNYPLIHEGLLYLGHNSGQMYAYDFTNGRVVWKKEDKGSYHAAPVAYKDNIVYGTTEGRVYFRNYLTGKLKYSIDLGSPIESKGVIYKGRVFFHLRNHKIFCLDVETGKILWAYKRSIPYLTTSQRVSRPLLINNRMYVGFADGNIAAFNIEEGVLLWERKISSGTKFVDVDVTPVHFENKILVGSLAGSLMVIEPNAGTILRRFDFSISRAPVIKGNVILLGTVQGELIALNRQFKIINRKKLGKYPISSIVTWKNFLTVSSVGGKVHLLDPVEFDTKEIFNLGYSHSAVFGQMQVHKDNLALYSSRNRLYVFK